MILGTVSPTYAGSNPAAAAALPGAAALPDPVSPLPQARDAAPAQPAPEAEALQQAARQINAFLKSSSTGVEFVVDGPSNQVVVRIVDSNTGQVLRQMPSPEMLALSESLDRMSGLLLTQKA
jgi:flagellar protein FlaG